MAQIILDGFGLDLPFPQNTGALNDPSRRIGPDARQVIVLHALRDVSLTLEPGSRVALFGQNGSGKSSLLRSIAGIYEPSVGRVRTEGRIAAMIDPGFGFQPELSGHDNIRLFCRYHRLSEPARRRVSEEAIGFAAIDDFLGVPVGSYSSGMTMRLGFALAMAIKPDIVLMDEWFFTADHGFLEKAARRLDEVLGTTGILVMSSHLLPVAAQWCRTACWLDAGRLAAHGPIEAVTASYLKAA
jgi:lipopolysaccharide transport system ATP-binding protein